jgi:hypothetical protein
MEAVNEPLRLMDIERELSGPGRDAALVKYDAVLAALSARVDAAMKEGLPPAEFPRAKALAEATTLARKILRLTVRVDGRTP